MICPYCKEIELEYYISKEGDYHIACKMCGAEWQEVIGSE